jgi:ATPase subunit of ABC transporter with duplicated ATPase domains
MLIVQELGFAYPNSDYLFQKISFSLQTAQKVALIGNNGCGKSTLLQILANQIQPSEGSISSIEKPYYIPQLFSNELQGSVADVLQIQDKRKALQAILEGSVEVAYYDVLQEDWDIEDRAYKALQYWHLGTVSLDQNFFTLSGGEQTKVFLAGITLHQPSFIIMDEPTNHLDLLSRKMLYEEILHTKAAMIIVSHDIQLLQLLSYTYEIHAQEMKAYGGNIDFYQAQKAIAAEAWQQMLKDKEKDYKKAKAVGRATIERVQKLDARGRKKQIQSGVPTIMLNTLKNAAEQSTARLKHQHEEKIDQLWLELRSLRDTAPATDTMQLGFKEVPMHRGKVLVKTEQINVLHTNRSAPLWQEDVSFTILSGDRVALVGNNGSGKTTLLHILTGKIIPIGNIFCAEFDTIYIDQHYSLLIDTLTVQQMAHVYNDGLCAPEMVNSKLTHFLFKPNDWNKLCSQLSGGERLRLALCCMSLQQKQPDVIMLDEPTNNLDLQNINILIAALANYKGTLIVSSHDEGFLSQLQLNKKISLSA